MAMDQELPLGLDDFSLAALWPPTPLIPPDLHPYQESVEEVKRRLAMATAELAAAREEACHKEQSIAALVELVRRTAEERDQLRQHLLLARELAAATTSSSSTDSDPILQSFSPAAVSHFEASSPAVLVEDNRSTVMAANRRLPQGGASSSSGPIVTSFYSAAVDCPTKTSSLALVDKDKSTVPSFFPAAVDRPALLKAAVVNKDKGTAMPVIDKDKSTAIAVDRGEVLLEQLAAKKPLPQRGRLLQAVMEAGPLLENLLVAGPVPRWRNPPPVQPVPSPVISVASGSRAPMG